MVQGIAVSALHLMPEIIEDRMSEQSQMCSDIVNFRSDIYRILFQLDALLIQVPKTVRNSTMYIYTL